MPEKLISHPALLLFLVFLHSFPNSNHPTGVISLYSNVPQDEVLIMVKAFTTKMLEEWITTQFCYCFKSFFPFHYFSSSNRRSLYTEIFDMKKPVVKTFEGVYIVVEAEDDSCWKKCLSRLYSSHHVHPTAAKQKTVHPSRFLGRNINVSVNEFFCENFFEFFTYWSMIRLPIARLTRAN